MTPFQQAQEDERWKAAQSIYLADELFPGSGVKMVTGILALLIMEKIEAEYEQKARWEL